MKRSIVLVVLAALLITSTAWAQNKKLIIGTKHDVGGNGCLSCHASHNGAVDSVGYAGTDQSSAKILLWDRIFSTTTFGVYDSPSMQSKAAEIGGATALANTDNRMNSLLCMSCHDGVTTAGLTWTNAAKNQVGSVLNSSGLVNDHPVNMAYNPTLDTGLDTVANVTTAGLKLYGATNTVQCSTCHTTHDPTIVPFLRKTNTGSVLCTTCHM